MSIVFAKVIDLSEILERLTQKSAASQSNAWIDTTLL